MNYNRLQKYHVIDKVVKNRRFGDMVVFGWSGTFAEPNGGPIAIDATREALFAWVLNKPSTVEALPESLKALAQYRFDRTAAVPNVPFQMLTALNLNAAEWAQVARAAGWRMVRMNLNTSARHGVFEIAGMTEIIAVKEIESTLGIP